MTYTAIIGKANKMKNAAVKTAFKAADITGKAAILTGLTTAAAATVAAKKTGEVISGAGAATSDTANKITQRIIPEDESNEKVPIGDKNIITPAIKNYYNTEYKRYKNDINNYTLESLYPLWTKKLNEYILFSLFSGFVILDKSINHKNYINNDDENECLVLMYQLHLGVKGILTSLDNLHYYLPLYLNAYDDNWITENFLKYFPDMQPSGTSFGNLENSIHSVCNSLRRHIIEIYRDTSKIEKVVERERMSMGEHVKDMGIQMINPWILISRAGDIANRIAPSVFNDKNKKMAISSYGICIEKWKELIHNYLPPIIFKFQKTTYQTFSQIVERDHKLLDRGPIERKDIKIELLKRYLKLKALHRSEYLIQKHSRNDTPCPTESLLHGDIIKKIYDISNNINFSFLIPINWED